MRRDRGDVGREVAVALIASHQRADFMRGGFERLGTFQRVAEVEALRRRQQFDRHDRGRVLRHVVQAPRAMRRHRDVVFLVGAGRHGVDGGRMREHAVLGHQRRGRHLRDHEAGIEARLLHQERRQPAHLRIDEDRGAAFGDVADLAQRHRELIGGEGDRLGVEIAAGDDRRFR